MSDWISVSDALPDVGIDVLCKFMRGHSGYGYLVAGRFEGYDDCGDGIGWASCETEDQVKQEITHWQPISPE